MLVIPSIDILDGRCVRLEKGNFTKMKIFRDDPIEQAMEFEKMGFETLHVVDLNAAREGKLVNFNIVKKIKEKTKLKIQYGGGVRREEVVEQLLSVGIDFIVLGSAVFVDQVFVGNVLGRYSPELFTASVDFLDNRIRVFGWMKETQIEIADAVNLVKNFGFRRLMYTDISADGTMNGHSVELARKLRGMFDGFLISSGGINCDENIEELEKVGIDAVVVGKAMYLSKISPKRWLKRYQRG